MVTTSAVGIFGAVWHQTITVVALVTAVADGVTNVMACEWAMMVSNNPMCFIISVHESHLTHDLIAKSREFGLSFCSDEQAKLSHVSGLFSLHDVDKWQLADFETYPAKRISAPMIKDAILKVECRVIGEQRLEHTLFIGEAIWAGYDPDKVHYFITMVAIFMLATKSPNSSKIVRSDSNLGAVTPGPKPFAGGRLL
jgi:flavin reductase (DIM6/NTAB) family NADH-FMN oxidoreductase RutF